MRIRTTRRRRGGFTLVEILLVVVILAMLAAFIVPNLFSFQEQAQGDMAKTQVKRLDDLIKQYRVTTKQYPSSEQGLKALVEKPEGEDAPKKWVQVIEEIPLDPWDNEYKYEFPGEHNGEKKPDIWSMGPDGQSGTDDDVGNWVAEGDGTNSEEPK